MGIEIGDLKFNPIANFFIEIKNLIYYWQNQKKCRELIVSNC